MAPIGKTRVPAWEHRDPDRRLAAVAESGERELLARLPEIARSDESAEVRRAAVARLDDLDTLVELCGKDGDSAVRASALDRALALIAREPAPDARRMAECLALASREQRLALLREASGSETRAAALARFDEPDLLAERALKDPDPGLRHAALERIEDPEQLERIARTARRTDRKLHRAAADRLETLRLRAGDPEAVRNRALELVEALENMARTGDTDAKRRGELDAQWRSLPEDGRAALAARFDGAVRVLERAAAGTPSTGPDDPEETGQSADEVPRPALPDALPELVHEAEVLAQQEAPSAKAAENLDRRWRGAWREEFSALPEADACRKRFTAALDRARHARERARQDRQQSLDHAEGLLVALEEHLESGDLHEARTVDHELKKLFQGPDLQPRKDQQRRLAAAHRRLHELRDWQHWANNRVRQRLCEEVEALPESDLHPDAVLETLKRAQKEWRELEESEKLSGEQRAYRASGPGLWRRFQAAGKRAFDHAKPFLEKRSELRQRNLDQARALIAELEAFEQADEVEDPRAMAGALSRARKTLKSLDELPPPERGPTARALRHSLDVLGRRLDEHRDRLVEAKQGLVAEARQLDPDQDLEQAVSRAKQLMGRWKRLDTLPRGRERKLWRALRKHLDPVFERRDSEQAEELDARARERESLESLCVEIERLAELPGPELVAATSELNRLRGQWQSAKGRPRAMDKRFREAVDAFRHRLAEQRAAEQFARVRALFQKASICRRLESGDLESARAEAAWTELPALSEDLESALRQRLEKAGEIPDDECLEANREKAERCVLTMELVSGVDSPPDAEEARMQLKVLRLNESMRGERREQDPDTEMADLLRDWALAGPLPGKDAAALEERAAKALSAFHGRSFSE